MMHQLTAPSVEYAQSTICAVLPAGTTAHIWLKALQAETPASLSATVGGIEIGVVTTDNIEEFSFRTLAFSQGGETTLSYDPSTTELSIVYCFSRQTAMTDGVRVLYTLPTNAMPDLPGSYHFRPPFGWMNDPNGFGRFGEKVHLFYQHYPHTPRWNTMHWGHAVSDDFLHWTHLPVFLFPPSELSARADGLGGAYSGSAIALPGEQDSVRIFFTEHVKGRRPEEQIQFAMKIEDMISADAAELILPHRPEGLDLMLDFRDPYVFEGPDGRWKMLLGSRDRSGGVILLYETDDPQAAGGWRFIGVLHREDRFKKKPAECPCMVPLGGAPDDPDTRWALIFGLLTSRDLATGRHNIAIATVGRFDGMSFAPDFEQELDFGTDAYAFQAFVDRSGPVGIAWLANWSDVSKDADMPTAMTLPRRLLLRDGALLTPPVDAVLTLRQSPIDTDGLLAGDTVCLGNGMVEIVLHLSSAGNAFRLDFEHPETELSVQLDSEGLSIPFARAGDTIFPRYVAAGARPSSIRIFLDAGSIEVFADDGRWTGTKRLPGFEGVRAARLVAPDGNVAAATIWQLKL
ncbi:GH32 C-terminal domain-containing protein [Rhizobium giardinii]|uniref:beta-fructofuranosidase n=1 Tax=Rhizobium giardinii TaxID=56731 RepID=A0A7W8UGB8_9HYPH|nr:GH32 C-terminal domain-containing protein [Rhizobium giardinii]MBB5538886.1 beta-fructofuranosidase [Rhizobium giardinii]